MQPLLTFFYTDYVGVSAALVGIIFLITRVFDGVSDIIMGFITDRTKSKYGKARPWILWMAVPYAVTFVAAVPCSGECPGDGAAVYIFVTYNLVNTVVYTALNLPYSTMASLITRDQKSRTSTQAIRIFCGPMGKMVVTVSYDPAGAGVWQYPEELDHCFDHLRRDRAGSAAGLLLQY